METCDSLHGVITQNIDNLHQEAGSRDVIEYHGTSHRLTCISCHHNVTYTKDLFETMPPRCPRCGGILKPDFVFFGEPIPSTAHQRSQAETLFADIWLVIGTTGEIMPASFLPIQAKQNGAKIIEVNIRPSKYTHHITDIFLEGKAGEILPALADKVCASNGA
jgi:NAD-dependent deacetylase